MEEEEKEEKKKKKERRQKLQEVQSLVAVLRETVTPPTLYSGLFGNLSRSHKLFISLEVGRRRVICTSQSAKKKKPNKKKKMKPLLMIQTGENWLLSQCNTKKENKRKPPSQWEAGLFSRKVNQQGIESSKTSNTKGCYLPEFLDLDVGQGRGTEFERNVS